MFTLKLAMLLRIGIEETNQKLWQFAVFCDKADSHIKTKSDCIYRGGCAKDKYRGSFYEVTTLGKLKEWQFEKLAIFLAVIGGREYLYIWCWKGQLSGISFFWLSPLKCSLGKVRKWLCFIKHCPELLLSNFCPVRRWANG